MTEEVTTIMAESMSEVQLVIYKKIVDGDLRKFAATSNDQPTGGGARDLRFSPAKEFMGAFKKLFPEFEKGVLRGYFSWETHAPTEVFIHPPTNSRPNEMRIANINECFPAQYVPDTANDCILLIIQDINGRVWPYFTSEYSLRNDNWHPRVKNDILQGLSARRNRNSSPMGYIDLKDGGSFTNGQ